MAVMSPPVGCERGVKGKAIAIENELAIGAGIDDRELRRRAARLNSPGSHLLDGIVARTEHSAGCEHLDRQCRLVGNADKRQRDVLRRNPP